jgi:hypothetical protein
VPSGPVTRARTKNLKEALNGPGQNIWRKMVLEEFGMPRDHEGYEHVLEPNSKPTNANLFIRDHITHDQD